MTYSREYAISKAIELAGGLREQNIKIKMIYLFGSFALESIPVHEWSDIDIAIISDDFSGNRFDDNLRIMPCVLKVDPRIETHPFTSVDFENSPFAQEEIVKKGILILP